MYLQKYIKYLICVIVVNFEIPRTGISTIEAKNDARGARGFLDALVGRLRPCGSCLCGRSNRKSARYLGGQPTATHEFPWIANIHVKSANVMSGVLINDRYVLTAASQLEGATAPEIKVSLGEYDRCNVDVSSQNSSVEAVIRHNGYSPQSRAHDIALLRLSRPTKLDQRISPVCMPNPGSNYQGQVATMIGWTEKTSVDHIPTATCRPRKLGLPILGRDTCIESGIDSSNLHKHSGCIGVLGSNSVICENDVGSPLLWRSYSGIYDLIGIMTDTNVCDGKPRVAVFTKVGPHIDWILGNTQDACYCSK